MRPSLRLAVVPFAVLLAACGEKKADAPPEKPATDLSKAPDAGATRREERIGGLDVRVLAEGEGAGARRGDVVDLKAKTYGADGNTITDDLWTGVVVGTPGRGIPTGVSLAVEGMKVKERRRL